MIRDTLQTTATVESVAIGGEVVLILVLLLLNGVFAASELAIVTARRPRLERRAEAGDRRAHIAAELAADPGQFLSTVQVGITLVGTFAGAFGGATIAEQLAPVIAQVEVLAPYNEGIALAIVVGAITYLSLILGELVPKRIALGNPEAVARLVAPPMRRLARFGKPIIWILNGSTEAVLRLLPLRHVESQAVTEDDLRAAIAQGTAGGAIRREEQEILERTLHLDDRQVAAIMLPRPQVPWLDIDSDTATLLGMARSTDVPCFLVCRGDVDDVVGVIPSRELLIGLTEAAPFRLADRLHAPLYVPETLTILSLLAAFRTGASPLAVVLDEFGGMSGTLTFEDLTRHLLGTVGSGPVAAIPHVREDGRWMIPGTVPFAEMVETLGIEIPEDQIDGFHTVAGFILAIFGRVPSIGESCTASGFTFTVTARSGNRIETVEATPTPETTRRRQPPGRRGDSGNR